MLLSAKRILVNTQVGNLLRNFRDYSSIVAASARSFEEIGDAANNRLFRKLLNNLTIPGKTFLDVGSHIGSVIADVSYYCPTVNIVAFEALPDKVADLRQRYPNVRIEAYAIGNKDGVVRFFSDTTETGYSSLSTNTIPGSHKVDVKELPLARLDGFEKLTDVDVIKIDVEGAEQGVIEGGENLLRSQAPIVYFESGPGDLPELGFTKSGLWQQFKNLDYSIHVPNRVAHDDPGLSLEMFLDSHRYPRRTTNYIAIPAMRRDEYRRRVRTYLKF